MQSLNSYDAAVVCVCHIHYPLDLLYNCHRCLSAHVVKVGDSEGSERQGALVESMMSVTPPAETQRHQVLGTSPHTD